MGAQVGVVQGPTGARAGRASQVLTQRPLPFQRESWGAGREDQRCKQGGEARAPWDLWVLSGGGGGGSKEPVYPPAFQWHFLCHYSSQSLASLQSCKKAAANKDLG